MPTPYTSLFESEGGEAAVEFSASGFDDPAVPPPIDYTQLGHYRSDQALFAEIVTPNPQRALQALAQFLPQLARRWLANLGFQLQREDPRLGRRWLPLAKRTIDARRAKGDTSTFPRPQDPQDLISGRFGEDVTVQDNTITVGVGPRGKSDDLRVRGGYGKAPKQRRTSREDEDNESGSPFGVGHHHTTRREIARPLGQTEEGAQLATTEMQSFVRQQAGTWATDMGSATLAAQERVAVQLDPDTNVSQLSLWSHL